MLTTESDQTPIHIDQQEQGRKTNSLPVCLQIHTSEYWHKPRQLWKPSLKKLKGQM